MNKSNRHQPVYTCLVKLNTRAHHWEGLAVLCVSKLSFTVGPWAIMRLFCILYLTLQRRSLDTSIFTHVWAGLSVKSWEERCKVRGHEFLRLIHPAKSTQEGCSLFPGSSSEGFPPCVSPQASGDISHRTFLSCVNVIRSAVRYLSTASSNTSRPICQWQLQYSLRRCSCRCQKPHLQLN